ncbi:MAG: trigger factor [Taibaiella sp.]|nr:trigger factor [Taibaiella sp.]
MATVTRENIGTLHDKITVKLLKDDYMPSFEKTLKQHAKTANVPGFRKGMVPAGMIRKMYGQSVFNDEVIRVAGKQLEDYMKNEKLSIFAQPMILPPENDYVLNMSNPSDVDFTFEIGLKPEIDAKSVIAGATLTRYKIAVTDKMMDDEMVRIKRRQGKVDPQTEVTDKENVIYSTYELCDADGNLMEGAEKVEDTEVLDKMPVKLQEMLMGKHPEDSMVIRPVEVCTEEELASFLKAPLKVTPEMAEQYFKFTITKVGHLIPAEMGTELYEQVFPGKEITTEEAFRAKVREELSFEFARIAGERLQNEMFELLVHNTPIQLPVAFLKRWMREGGEQRKSAEDVENEFGSFDHQLRWQLISDQIMGENGINVTRSEVMTDIKTRVLAYFGMGADDEDETPWMADYLTKISKDEKMMDETYRRLLFGKLFSFLETQFNIVEKDIDEEAFFALSDAHAMHHHHNH